MYVSVISVDVVAHVQVVSYTVKEPDDPMLNSTARLISSDQCLHLFGQHFQEFEDLISRNKVQSLSCA